MPNGEYADVSDPSTWSTYAECTASGMPLVGYVFHKDDPYAGIDCDDHDDNPATPEQKKRFRKIKQHTDSYTELSVGGKGIHIIVRANAPLNFIKDNIEVFDHGKYFILTGKRINGAKIKSAQSVVSTLCKEYATVRAQEYVGSSPSRLSDERLVEMASEAVNGDKFEMLWKGKWEGHYPSQSEADLAFFNIVTYYSTDDDQVIRLFHMSQLGQRAKAHKAKYLDYNLKRAREDQPPPIDLSAVIDKLTEEDDDETQGNGQSVGRRRVSGQSDGVASKGKNKKVLAKKTSNPVVNNECNRRNEKGGNENAGTERPRQRNSEKDGKRAARDGTRDRREDSRSKTVAKHKHERKGSALHGRDNGGNGPRLTGEKSENGVGRKRKPSDNDRVSDSRKSGGVGGKDAANTSASRLAQPGLLGDIGSYITESAVRPVAEVGIAASRCLLPGICGASHNVSGTGPNVYVMIVGKTGTGKEGAASGISRLIAACVEKIPSIITRIGPSYFASGQAILKLLPEKPCFLSVVGEFGIHLKIMSHPNAPSHEQMKRAITLDLYNKSGFNDFVYPSAYADKEKSTETVRAPSVTILGEGTPKSIFSELDDELMESGLIPRFSLIQYKGIRKEVNKNALFMPPKNLVRDLSTLTAHCMQIEQQQNVVNVLWTKNAGDVFDDFDRYCNELINKVEGGATVEMWNRAHLKALKLACIAAIGLQVSRSGVSTPLITRTVAQWAVDQIILETFAALRTILDGLYTVGNAQQEHEVMGLLKKYHTLSEQQKISLRIPKRLRGDPNYVPFEYLRRRTRGLACFKNDRRGPVQALRDLMKELVDSAIVMQLDHRTVYTKFKLNAPVYWVPVKEKKK